MKKKELRSFGFDIALDGREIVSGGRRTGLSRYLISFMKYLGENKKYSLIIADERTDTKFISDIMGEYAKFLLLKHSNILLDQFLIPINVIRRTDVYFSIYPKFPVVLPFFGVKVIITIADMIDFSYLQRVYLKIFAKLPYKIITISDTWKRKIDKHIGRDTTRVYLDMNYLKERFSEQVADLEGLKTDLEELKSFDLEPERYILYVGNFNPHKNLRILIEAFKMVKKEQKDIRLVLAGGGGKSEQNFELPDGCKILRSIDDKTLGLLYKHALLFVFPSLVEGLGVPPLESCYFGKPVLVSDIDVFREVVGDCAVFFDPNSPKDLADKMLYLCRNENLRKSMKEKSKKNSEKFLSFDTGDLIYNLVFGYG